MKTAHASSGTPHEIDRMLVVMQDSRRQAGQRWRAWQLGMARRWLRRLMEAS